MAELAILGYIVGGYPLDWADDSPGPSLTLVVESPCTIRWSTFRGLLAGSMALVLAGSVVNQTALARASRSDIAPSQTPLSLELSPPASSPTDSNPPGSTIAAIAPSAPPEPAAQPPIVPLAVPPQATEPPLGKGRTAAQLKLPPPPPSAAAPNLANIQVAPPALLPDVSSLGQAPPPETSPPVSWSEVPVSMTLAVSPPVAKDPALSFDLEMAPAAIAPVLAPALPEDPGVAVLSAMLQAAFAGGVDSLVAIAVGSAEGTRTPRGDYTAAYQGHTDPGNGVWNLGTFSYQHGAASPVEADRKQIQRLQRQAHQLQQIAAKLGLELSLAEQLNGIDLANQSPRAALSRGGYLDRLLEARQQGITGEEAILWARTRAFLDPDTQRWNAPGLGNTTESITRDQARRMVAVQRAIALNPTKALLISPSTNSATASHAIQPSSSLSEISPDRSVAKNTDSSISRLLSFDQP
ncbi:hypothetical protein [Thermoleptolyngbya sp. C42_A2020_037]|uniref:hypothetical protein n=1 Tax=Thermoleptolyngbya sp. C42_A2020_037 TaxID=2747799 RepID=UPI001A0176F7|nr:hypothetical protein [Thermoleptolyngbya sp. C42_A2020_037]MBF2084745.1 hypothetical protein [Thermoleptolyngbya sp. C42_A2020_037]